MRESMTLILLALLLLGLAAGAVHLWRRANYTRWLRRGHSDYSKVAPRRGLFG